MGANAAYRQGDDAEAIRASSLLIEMHPRAQETGEAHYIRGLARCRSNRVEAGKADLAAALNLTKRKELMALAHAKLADLAYDAADTAEAEKQYRAALDHVPPGAPPADRAMYRLGSILQQRGQWNKADLMFRRVRHLFPGTELARLTEARVGARQWSVQAGAFDGAAVAKELRSRLRASGLSARVDLELRGGRMMRLVRVGSYPTYGGARADLAKVRKICGDAFITPAG